MQTSSPPATSRLTGYFMLASLGPFWGLNWPGMKIALEELPVWWFRSFSVGAGAAGLLLIAALSGLRVWPARADLRPLLICALFNIIGWHILTAYGVSLMPAGRASIIAFTMPVWAAMLAALILGEPITPWKIAGLILGVAGLGALIGPDLAALGATPTGALFMLGASISWAAGAVLFKKFAWTLPVASAVGWQLAIGALVITSFAAALEPSPNLTALSWRAICALAYLFAIPMIYCQWAFFSVVQIFPAAIASIGTLAVPVVGVFSSAWILGEPIGVRDVVALALIFMALFVVLVAPGLAGGWRARPS
ncbi:DMT family transporter [Pikeienuella piscinae]|uniref:DMT family transporter n=1 Tax=Pikeienuella piscinae TaxID=2748098 RepID=A0A7M3T5R5_9RHOB|nr:DMT family transporter [Pikeienuella piscinae]QIE57346.1 DMT family transporter [Pikeienuella piscinae]